MAVVNLPDAPSNGTTQTVGGITYTYNSTKGYWTAAASSGGGGGGGASVTTDDSAPGSPSDGDLWYDTDDGGMFVYYEDADSSQWVEVIGSAGSDGAAGAAGAAGADGSATVVADTTALLAISSPSAGDQVYVTANNTLYFYNGSGWYKIALINTNPTISGVSSSYALAIDGTATTVTITASDPEGLPITYSIASDTSGNTATVAQGTGASTNVFTVTPSTNSAHAGSFSLTFRASDGVNFATAPATFTLQFSVVNSKYTTALITSVGANTATNTTFTDASTNAVSFSVSNVYQTTFSPYRHGGYSTYFDGSGDYLTIPAIQLGTSPFTIEMWVNLSTVTTSSNIPFLSSGTNSSTGTFQFEISSNSKLGFQYDSASTFTTSSGLTANTWHHVAIVREGTGTNETKLYLDGVLAGSSTVASDFNSTANIFVARNRGNSTYPTGYITDVRVVSGTAVYTSAFTPTTERLTAVTNTSLLTCHLPYIADGSTNAHTVTPNGNVSVKAFTPYDYTEEYSATTHGGSLCGNANGKLTGTLPSALGSGDFTIEGWFYAENFGSNTGIVTIGNHGANGIAILLENTGKFRIDVSTSYSNNSTSNVQLNTWNHFKVIRSSGTITAYLNGAQEQSFSNALYLSATNITIGGRGGLTGYQHEGNLADIKVTTSASSDTTVPTSVVSSTNALFHLPFIEAGIIDKSQTVFNAILEGNAQSSTTQTKYLSSSMYFDGSGDFIEISHDPVFNLTKDFTIECWAYFNALSSSRVLIEKYDNTNSASWELYWRAAGTSIAFYADATPLLQDPSTSTIITGQWYHIAVSRTGSTVKLFIDGTEVDSATSSTAFTATVPMEIGRQRVNNTNNFNGYLSDVRVTKGLARYTSNFTAPTAALQG